MGQHQSAPYQRKYVDLIREVSSKWVNWDPPVPIEVGAYGTVDSHTGELRIDGNIYDPAFQVELDKLGIPLRIADYPPKESGEEDDFIISTKGARRIALGLGPEANVAGLVSASLKGQWQFEHGRRDALLIMHRPRMRFLPPNAILDTLYRVPKLNDKYLVTGIHLCPAYSMYLSNKSGEKLSLALVGQVPVAGLAGVTAGAGANAGWWSDISADFLRKACDKAGLYSFTPLYRLQQPLRARLFRGHDEDEGEQLWIDAMPPWDPLDEDGEVDALDEEEEEEEEEAF